MSSNTAGGHGVHMRKGDLVVYKMNRDLGTFFVISKRYSNLYRANTYHLGNNFGSDEMFTVIDHYLQPATTLEVMRFICT